MPSTSSTFLDPLNHRRSVQQILEADIVLAIDSRIGIEFVLFGRQIYYGPRSSESTPTLTILTIEVNGIHEVKLACRLVQDAKGRHEFRENETLRL